MRLGSESSSYSRVDALNTTMMPGLQRSITQKWQTNVAQSEIKGANILDMTHLKVDKNIKNSDDLIFIKSNYSNKESVFDILLESAKWLHSCGVNQWPLDWLYKVKPKIETSVENGNFHILYAHGEIAGIIEITIDPQEIWDSIEGNSVYISKFAIPKKFKGNGVGSLILKIIKNYAFENRFTSIRLDCSGSNEKLKEFYRSNGFKEVNNVVFGGFKSTLMEFTL